MSGATEEDDMIEDCMKRESKLGDWEREFIQSLSEQRAAGRMLSDKQTDKLLSIWMKVT